MSDIIVNVGLFSLIAFLLAKAVREGYESSMSKKTKKKTPSKKSKSWWKKNISPLWEKATFLKITYVVSAFIVGVALLYLFGLLYLEILWIDWDTVGTQDSIIRNLAIAFLGTTSGIAALFGIWLAIRRTEENKRQNDIADEQNTIANEQNRIATKQSDLATKQSKLAIKQSDLAAKQNEIANRQANTAEQGLITDRLNKAVEGLGRNDKDGPVVEVRLGALYALERIAKDSIRDHIQIMEILCAYVRANSPSSKKDKEEKPKPLREDIHAAVTIIGRREKWPEGKQRLAAEKSQSYRIDLKNCNLHHAELTRANLRNANLDSTDLRNATLISADLSETWLTGANMNSAWITNGDITGAWLDNASMEKTMIRDTTTDEAYAQIVDLSKCHRLTKEQLDKMFCGFGTKIPSNLEPCPEHWPTAKLPFEDFQNSREKWISEKRAKETKAKAKPSELVDLDNPPF